MGFVLQANPNIMNANGPVSVDYVTGSPPVGSWPNLIGVEDAGAEFMVCTTDNFQAANVGGSCNLSDAAPDPLFRQSRQELVSLVLGTQFRIIGLVNSPAMNAYGTNALVAVRMLQTLQG
jgi:hypothetical protein